MKRLKRRALASVLTLALVLTVAGICLYIRSGAPTTLPAQSARVEPEPIDSLTKFRTEREQLRQRQRAELNDIIHDAETDPETLALAQRQLMTLMEAETNELQLEGILAARGFGDPLVSVGGGAVNVLIGREALTRQETAVILDLTLRQTGVTSGNVKIIPINK